LKEPGENKMIAVVLLVGENRKEENRKGASPKGVSIIGTFFFFSFSFFFVLTHPFFVFVVNGNFYLLIITIGNLGGLRKKRHPGRKPNLPKTR
jgi:hypothetical protein